MQLKGNRQIKEILTDELKDANSIFKDIRKIALDYIPNTILFRDSEIKQLTQYIKPVFSSFTNRNNKSEIENYHSFVVFILGNSSTGKSITVKRFGMDLETWTKNSNLSVNFYFKHVNCVRYRTVYAIMISLIQSFVPNFPSRGFSTLELIQYFKKYLKTSNSYLLLSLDGINSLELDKDYSILLISLTINDNESYINNISESNRISLMLISNNPNYLLLLDSSIRTHLEKNIIYFKNYKVFELKAILETRVKETLIEDSWDKTIIQSIIDRMENNDPRLALEVLWRAVREAERESKLITEVHIEQAFQDISPGISAFENVLSLRYQLKVFLFILVQNICRKNNKDYTTIKEIQYRFSSIKSHLKERMGVGYTSLYNYAQELNKLNIIQIEIIGKNRKGRKSILRPDFTPSRILDLLNEDDLFSIKFK